MVPEDVLVIVWLVVLVLEELEVFVQPPAPAAALSMLSPLEELLTVVPLEELLVTVVPVVVVTAPVDQPLVLVVLVTAPVVLVTAPVETVVPLEVVVVTA